MSKASTDLHGGYYSDCVISQFTGRGTGQVWNPTRILNALKNLVRWQSPKTLRKYKTTLFCQSCQTRCPVVDAYPNGECKLSCGCRRKVSSQTPEEYRDLVEQAASIQRMEEARWQ
jgi:hypothetical protein